MVQRECDQSVVITRDVPQKTVSSSSSSSSSFSFHIKTASIHIPKIAQLTSQSQLRSHPRQRQLTSQDSSVNIPNSLVLYCVPECKLYHPIKLDNDLFACSQIIWKSASSRTSQVFMFVLCHRPVQLLCLFWPHWRDFYTSILDSLLHWQWWYQFESKITCQILCMKLTMLSKK